MFYISSKQGNKYGITDTRDNVEEFYTLDAISTLIIKGIKIAGVLGVNRRTGNPEMYIIPKSRSKILSVVAGTPVVLKFSKETEPKQCVVVDVTEQGIMLYDGTFFSFTFDFISRANMVFDFERNDPVKLAKLMQRLNG